MQFEESDVVLFHGVVDLRKGAACESEGWRLHAWCLMGNHYHLLVETPEPDRFKRLSAAIGANRKVKILLGRY